MWSVVFVVHPIRETFHPLLTDLKIATQFPSSSRAAHTVWAPNFQYFRDSPTELADFALREWQVPGPDGKDYTFRLAIHSEDDAADIDRFVGMAKAVVAQHNKIGRASCRERVCQYV